ncbi:unnamed protein product [Spirodela intermedia]|uniref:ACB domain-containing protein n=1 Tax=Spirodela intermedia TaxID=51605 RepID=A0A7I8K2U4_SPIIN|nr:unnamed protein product [Spirodela intermedia]
MELLLELLLTVLSSLLIAFFFSKIVSVSSSNSKDPDAHLHPEGLQSLPGRSSTSAATHGIEGDAEVNREWFEGLDEARERADTCRDECIGTRFEESIHLEDQYVKEVVGGSQEVRAEDLDVKKVDIQGNPDAAVTEIEENLGTETSGDGIENIARCMTVEEEPLDEDRKINFSLSPDEEEAFQVPDIREAGTESVIDGARDALLGTVDVKVAKTDIGSMFNEDDDWEGIEKSDVEKLFGEAAEFVGSTEGNEALSELSNDLQMQLFGLRKIATEGPCYESQPLALKASARAKWYN